MGTSTFFQCCEEKLNFDHCWCFGLRPILDKEKKQTFKNILTAFSLKKNFLLGSPRNEEDIIAVFQTSEWFLL